MTNLKKIVTTVLCMAMLVGTAGGVMQSTSSMTVSAATTTQTVNPMPSGAFCVNGGYYIANNNGGVSFIGVQSTSCNSFNVPVKVKCSANNVTYNVTEVGYPTDRQPIVKCMESLTSVTVDRSLKKIHAGAFYSTNLQSFNFNGSPLELTEVGDFAFTDTNIGYFEFYNAKKLNYIGKHAFNGTRIDQVNLGNTVVESIANNAFMGLAVTNVTLPGTLDSIGENAFENCTKLTNVNVSPTSAGSCDLWKVGSNAFKGCKALKKFTVPESERSITFGSNGVGCFDISATSTLTLTVPNPYTGKFRGISLNGSGSGVCNDITSFKNRNLLINGGRVIVSDNMTSKQLGISYSKSLTRVYPD